MTRLFRFVDDHPFAAALLISLGLAVGAPCLAMFAVTVARWIGGAP